MRRNVIQFIGSIKNRFDYGKMSNEKVWGLLLVLIGWEGETTIWLTQIWPTYI
jgi:hypothetical protein